MAAIKDDDASSAIIIIVAGCCSLDAAQHKKRAHRIIVKGRGTFMGSGSSGGSG